MDFLDPRKKKSHRRRLFIGYILVAIAVAMGTLVLLFSSYGYWVDSKTGDIIQNGTVFVDSEPSGSDVYLDGVLQGNKTSTRLVLPGGRQYNIRLTKDGYRQWQRTFALEGGKIERLVYPYLILNDLTTTEDQLYSAKPSSYMQSPDRRWLVVQQLGQQFSFDLYDLNKEVLSPQTVTIPDSILTSPDSGGTLSLLEWAYDNRNLLIKRQYDDKSEFIVFDTQKPEESRNVNTTLTVNPTTVKLRDKKSDLLYLYDTEGGLLRQADLKAKTVSGAILSSVLGFTSYGNDVIVYAAKDAIDTGKIDFRIRDSEKASYLLRTTNEADKYLLDVSEYNNSQYVAIGTDKDNAVFVYQNPLPTLKGQSKSPLLVRAVLRTSSPEYLSFSDDSQFISVQAGSKLAVYDIDGDRQYSVDIGLELAAGQQIAWMDNFRFNFVSSENSYMVDFDGSNQQKMMPCTVNATFFSQDYKQAFCVAPSTVANGRYALTRTILQQ